jgi:hypothetical protein
MRTCGKSIKIQIPHLGQDIDYGYLIASEYFKTGMLVDNCGNPRIVFLPDPCVPLTGEEDCENTPLETILKGNVHVECNLSAGSMTVDDLSGNGCNLNNTDDTKIIGFEYDPEESELVLRQQNSKICDEEEQEIEELRLSTAEFAHNTIIEDFSFGEDEDGEENNLLTIRDSDEREFTVDLSKYCNENERYVAPGSYVATREGVITLPYNIETDETVEIDISEAVHGFRDMEFDRCRGILTVTTSLGDVVNITGFPTNISIEGYTAPTNFSGSIHYTIENKVIFVNCNFVVNSFVGSISTLGFLPIRLKRSAYVWLTSMHGTSYSRLNRVQLTISTDGQIQILQYQIPERVQDSFCLVFDSLDPNLLDQYCNNI